MSTKGDVYSFGVVMLEMLTRKGPTDNMFGSMGVSLPMWVRRVFSDRLYEVLIHNSMIASMSYMTMMQQSRPWWSWPYVV